MKNEDLKKAMPINPMEFDEGTKFAEEKPKAIKVMDFDVKTKSVEEKRYIILLPMTSNDEMFDGNYKICTGRTECYRTIEHLLESFGTDLDIDNSIVITETKQTETETGDRKYYLLDIEECVSVYAFCKNVEAFYGDTAFDIDYYRNAIDDDGTNERSTIEDEDKEAEEAYASIDEMPKFEPYRSSMYTNQSEDTEPINI